MAAYSQPSGPEMSFGNIHVEFTIDKVWRLTVVQFFLDMRLSSAVVRQYICTERYPNCPKGEALRELVIPLVNKIEECFAQTTFSHEEDMHYRCDACSSTDTYLHSTDVMVHFAQYHPQVMVKSASKGT